MERKQIKRGQAYLKKTVIDAVEELTRNLPTNAAAVVRADATLRAQLAEDVRNFNQMFNHNI